MNEIIGHFGLVLAAITALNALIASRRVNAWFPNDPSAQADARRFVWRAAGWFGGFFLALECVTLATGAGSPMCLFPMSGASGTVGYIGWAMWIGWVGGLTIWVVHGQGAERLARYAPLFSRNVKPGHVYNPRIVRAIVVLWCVATLAIPLAIPKSEPAIGCGQGGPATHTVSRGGP